MTFESWSLFLAALLTATVSPGPNVMVVVKHAFEYGLRGAAATVAGNVAALLIMALAAALGMGTLLHQMPGAVAAIRFAGGAYLIYLGLKSLWGLRRIAAADLRDHVRQELAVANSLRLASKGFAVSISNPKAILFLSALFPQFLDETRPLAPQFGILFVTIMVSVGAIHMGYALLASYWPAAPEMRRLRVATSALTGVVLLALGIGLMLPF